MVHPLAQNHPLGVRIGSAETVSPFFAVPQGLVVEKSGFHRRLGSSHPVPGVAFLAPLGDLFPYHVVSLSIWV